MTYIFVRKVEKEDKQTLKYSDIQVKCSFCGYVYKVKDILDLDFLHFCPNCANHTIHTKV